MPDVPDDGRPILAIASLTMPSVPPPAGSDLRSAVTQIAISPTDSANAFASFSGFSGGTDTLGHVFRTRDSGATWTDISAGLPNIPTWSIALDPRGTTAARVIYVGTDAGVYYSTDMGTTWARYLTGMPNAQVTEMDIAPNLGILAAGTHGGIWGSIIGFASGCGVLLGLLWALERVRQR